MKKDVVHVLLVGLQRFTRPVGLCRYTANLFKCLGEVDSLQVTLVLGSWQKEYYRSALQIDVSSPNIIWINLRNPVVSRYGWCLWNLPRLARTLDVDVVHLLHQLPVWKEFFHCPVVLTIHDLYAYDTPEVIGYPNVYVNRMAVWSSIRASAEVVSISYFTNERLRHWFPHLEESMSLPVIYQTVSIGRSELPAGVSVPPEFLLCVAQHRKNKNLDLVMESYFLALDRNLISKNTQLVIVGSEGPETERLRDISKPREGVWFLHAISDEHLAYLYQTCGLFICASSIEGFCLPLAEAMLASCRVVCADIPIFHEVAGERATYFDLQPRSPEAVVEAMLSSLSSDLHLTGSSQLLGESPSEQWLGLYRRVQAHQS